MKSYNNISLDQVPLIRKSRVKEIRLYPYMIGLLVDRYISVTVPHAINKLYTQINEYIIIRVTVIIQNSTKKPW